MFEAMTSATDQLWRNGLAVIPLVVMVAVLIRFGKCRPSTRHLLWAMVLAWLVLPPLIPAVDWAATLRVSDASKPKAVTSDTTSTANGFAPNGATSADALTGRVTPRLDDGVDAGKSPNVAKVAAGRSRELPRSDSPLLLYVDRAGDSRFVEDLSSQSVACSEERTPKTLARASAPDRPAIQQTRPVHAAQEFANQSIAEVAQSWPTTIEVTPCPATQPTPTPTPPAILPSLHVVQRCCGVVAGLDSSDPAGLSHAPARTGSVVLSDPASDRPTPTYEFHYDAETEPALHDAVAPGVVARVGPPEFGASRDSNGVAPPHPAVVTATQSPEVSTPTAWQAWSASVLALRDAFVAIPPVPASLWIAGVMVLGVMLLLRLAAFGMRLRRARPADRSVRRLVDRASNHLGLRRAPQVLMVDDRVSPMICCGLWPRLILPSALWDELDGPGRNAVIYHELAHLRRRDHLTSWLEQAVGALYWWHPVVWWVRGRLHAEAENCCDAWVTHLLPKERRAYAQVLLRTRAYLSREAGMAPAMTIGMTSGRAKRFARRLTMVMTNRVKPGVSASGIALVLTVAVVGWLTSPAKSCPNEKKQESKQELIKSKTTFEQHLAEKDASHVVLVSDRDGDEDHDVNKLEKRMDRLEKKLEKLMQKLDRMGEDEGRGDMRRQEREKRELREEREDRPEREERVIIREHGDQGGVHRTPPRAPKPPRAPRPPRAPKPPHAPKAPRIDSHAKEWRDYTLSKGKLEAFTALMSRSDVPVLVRPGDGKIGIQATPKQHKVFKAFFQMIDPSDSRADALGDVFFNSSACAPAVGRVMVMPHGNGCGDCAAACAGCADCCGGSGDCCGGSGSCGHDDCSAKLHASAAVRAEVARARDEARRALEHVRAELGGEAAVIRDKARDQARKIQEQVRQQMLNARAHVESQGALLDSLNEQIESLRDKAEELREKAEELRGNAEELRNGESSDSDDHDAHVAFAQQASAMLTGADGLERDAGMLDQKADMLEGKSGAIEQDIESLREFVEQLEQKVSSIEEAQGLIDEGTDGNMRLAQSMAELTADMAAHCGKSHTANTAPEADAASIDAVRVAPPEPVLVAQLQAKEAAKQQAVAAAQVAPVDQAVAAEVANAIAASVAAVHEASASTPQPTPKPTPRPTPSPAPKSDKE